MSDDKKKVKKTPGRPPKNITTPVGLYKGIVEKPHIEGAINEIIITESMMINNCLKTFKSLGAENISINWSKDRLIIYAEVLDSKNEMAVSTGVSKRVYLEFKAKEIYSYYCSEEITMKLKNISDLEEFFEDLAENSDKIILYYNGISNALNADIIQKSLGNHKSKNIISIESIEPNTEHFNCPESIENVAIEFRSINACELKQYLNKKSRKRASECKLVAKENIMTLDFKKMVGNTHTSEFDNKLNKQIINHKPDFIFEASWPKSDIYSFCIHFKKTLNMFISEDQLFLVYNNKPGIYIKYLIEI